MMSVQDGGMLVCSPIYSNWSFEDEGYPFPPITIEVVAPPAETVIYVIGGGVGGNWIGE